MVVFIHARNLQINFETGSLITNAKSIVFIENFFSRGVPLVAVPLFFTISGYLFFLNMEISVASFRKKILKRFRTLMVPFLFWSISSFMAVYLVQLLPGTEKFFGHYHLRNCSLSTCLKTIFIVPVPGQLWFIRHLFLYVLLTPIIYYLLRVGGISVVLGLGIVWLGHPVHQWPPFIIYGLFFFTMGNFIAIWGTDWQLTITKPRWLIPLWLGIVVVRIYYFTYHGAQLHWLKNSGILIGMAALWFNYDLYGFIFERKQLFWITSFTFFVYVSHTLILVPVQKFWAKMLGISNVSTLAGYFVCPLLVIPISIALAILLKRYCRGLYNVMTGGR